MLSFTGVKSLTFKLQFNFGGRENIVGKRYLMVVTSISSIFIADSGSAILPHLPLFFFLNKNQDHFFKSLKHLKQLSYIIQLLHMI